MREFFRRSGMHSPNVLIVDDDPDIRALVSLRFEKAGAAVRAVSGGEEALAVVKAMLTLGTPYTLIVLDIRMPGMNGNEVARHIREAGHTGAIVGFTAVASATGRRTGTDSGMDAYISKELLNAELVEALLRNPPHDPDRLHGNGTAHPVD